MTDQKDAAAVRVFPPAVPLLTILLGVGLSRVWPVNLGFEPSPPTRYWAGGLIVVAAILGLGLWSVLLVRRSGQSENPWKPTLFIVDRGPFRISRNPMVSADGPGPAMPSILAQLYRDETLTRSFREQELSVARAVHDRIIKLRPAR